MDKIDLIFNEMDPEKREALKRSINDYKESGDPAAKAEALKILKDCEDGAAIRRFLNEI